MKNKNNSMYPLITLGSPYGIGYEIFLRSLEKKIFSNHCPFCIGSRAVMKLFIKILKTNNKYLTISPNEINNIKAKNYDFILINIDDNNTFNSINEISSDIDGLYAYKSIDTAAKLVLQGYFNSIVTLPVSKANINLIDSSFKGHTEFFKEKWNEDQVFMTFFSKKIIIILLTTHIPLENVSKSINPQLVMAGIKIAIKLKNILGIKKDICFLGLNPHAGENGLLGEEDLWIKDIIEKYNIKNKMNIKGPIPSDTAFTKFSRKLFRIYIANYHDQGLIPFKMLAFKSGVNLSFGMKSIRTSVDHGTAVNLIGKKKASLKSFINAYKLAIKLSNQNHALTNY